jgi:hypothetical protein
MAEIYSYNLVKALNAIAQEYRGKLEENIKSVLSEARYRNTGGGVDSVNVEVRPGDSNNSPALVIKIADHVLILNKSKMEWTNLPRVNELLKWARSRKSNEKEAKKLAWAVAWDKKKNDTWKSKKWRKKGIGTVLREMNEELLIEFDKAKDKDFQEGIDAAMKKA